MLRGLVTKNAIVRVDLANHARERGNERRQALLDVGELGLRPIDPARLQVD